MRENETMCVRSRAKVLLLRDNVDISMLSLYEVCRVGKSC
jgi:hypothetical protein